MREIFLEDGLYTTPAIGSPNGAYPESSFAVEGGRLLLDSALYDEKRPFDELFADPRAANFVDAVVRHQIHLLDVRQLSMPEAFETRAGAGRMNRLTTLVESAAMGAKLGASFEQAVQVMLSDVNVTIDSHRLGDHLVGDYRDENTRDYEVNSYIYRSSMLDYLVYRGAVQSDGFLVDSPVKVTDLTDPTKPRRHDIAECDRPDGNLDRTPFTLFEGLYLVDQKEIVEASKSMIRVEVKGQKGGVEERLACNDVEAARLLYMLSVRHLAEHWGEPMHHVVEELLSVADKYKFLRSATLFGAMQEYHPVDYLRTSESAWYNQGNIDPFVVNTQKVASDIARLVRGIMQPVQTGEVAYAGPSSSIPGLSIEPGSRRKAANLSASVGKHDKTGEIWVALPEHKRRAPIDSLVATPTGLKRVSEIDPSLAGYADTRFKWLGAYLAKITLPVSIVKELAHGFTAVSQNWATPLAKRSSGHPLKRPQMPKHVMSAQIDAARAKTIELSFSAA